MNRNGSVRDIVLFAVVFFTIVLGLFVISFTGTTIYNGLVTAPVVAGSTPTVSALGGINTVTARFDFMALGVFIGLILGTIITGWLVGGHPLFMLGYILVVAITVSITAVLANSWEQITAFSQFATTLTTFPIANHLVLYLPLYVSVVGFIGIIVMFAKPMFQDMGGV